MSWKFGIIRIISSRCDSNTLKWVTTEIFQDNRIVTVYCTKLKHMLDLRITMRLFCLMETFIGLYTILFGKWIERRVALDCAMFFFKYFLILKAFLHFWPNRFRNSIVRLSYGHSRYSKVLIWDMSLLILSIRINNRKLTIGPGISKNSNYIFIVGSLHSHIFCIFPIRRWSSPSFIQKQGNTFWKECKPLIPWVINSSYFDFYSLLQSVGDCYIC